MFEVDLLELINADALAFYALHEHDPIDKLLLRYASDPVQTARAIQLEARNRAAKKLPLWHENPAIVFPPKANLEQASSEITAKYKAGLVDYQTSIDLTGGTGIDSWQFALKANKHIYVEPNEDLCKLAKHNFAVLGLQNIEIVCATAEQYLEAISSKVDLIYIDPSRRTAGSRKVNLADYEPDVISLLPTLLNRATNILIKVSPLADITYLINLFNGHCKAIHVFAVKNDCKEVLLHITEKIFTKPVIETVNFTDERPQLFCFTREEENVRAAFATDILRYVYEPNAAVLKAGAYNSLAQRFGVEKLHPNSHLYTSNDLKAEFPGAVYHVLEVAKPFKLSQVYKDVSVACRNFPEKPEQIRNRLKIKDGNTFKLFATTVSNKKIFVIGKAAD